MLILISAAWKRKEEYLETTGQGLYKHLIKQKSMNKQTKL